MNPLDSPVLRLQPGRAYSRREVLGALGISPIPTGGNWYTGYSSFRGSHFIFCNVGAAGRTGHDYSNEWVTPTRLRWFGKTSAKSSSPQVQAMTGGVEPVYLFHRSDNRKSFTFAGSVRAADVRETQPVEVLWELSPSEVLLTEELREPGRFIEGAVRRVTVNGYERDRNARNACIAHYGAICSVCQFRFVDRYGDIGRDFIHVHHLVSLASIGEQYRVDPVKDLRPVCPNCHAMLHTQDPPMLIEDLRSLLSAIAMRPRHLS